MPVVRRCVCGCGGCGGLGSRRLGGPRMTLESLARKLKACVVPHEARTAFLRLYEEAEGNEKRVARSQAVRSQNPKPSVSVGG